MVEWVLSGLRVAGGRGVIQAGSVQVVEKAGKKVGFSM
jgi:hypothetical protein